MSRAMQAAMPEIRCRNGPTDLEVAASADKWPFRESLPSRDPETLRCMPMLRSHLQKPEEILPLMHGGSRYGLASPEIEFPSPSDGLRNSESVRMAIAEVHFEPAAAVIILAGIIKRIEA